MQKLVAKVFQTFQKIKINILPNHYYSNIPDFSLLKREDFWKAEQSMTGIQGTAIEPQIAFVKSCIDGVPDKSVLSNNDIHTKATNEQDEYGYGIIEADFLYAFICAKRPKKVIQIGCGVSTSIILRASKKINHKIKLVCIEPYPSKYLRDLHEKGEIELITEKAQVVTLKDLTSLEAGDLFFVDSTHTVKVGSEVNRIILEVLPRLKKGVFVHFHDISFPYDYQRNLDSTIFFWNESTLLHAFLINNAHYTIKVSQSMLHYKAKSTLEELFPNYKPQKETNGIPNNNPKNSHFPSSTYLEVV